MADLRPVVGYVRRSKRVGGGQDEPDDDNVGIPGHGEERQWDFDCELTVRKDRFTA